MFEPTWFISAAVSRATPSGASGELIMEGSLFMSLSSLQRSLKGLLLLDSNSVCCVLCSFDWFNVGFWGLTVCLYSDPLINNLLFLITANLPLFRALINVSLRCLLFSKAVLSKISDTAYPVLLKH